MSFRTRQRREPEPRSHEYQSLGPWVPALRYAPAGMTLLGYPEAQSIFGSPTSTNVNASGFMYCAATRFMSSSVTASKCALRSCT